MFEHENFDVYKLNNLPLNRDCYIMSEKYMQEYEEKWVEYFKDRREFEPVGSVGVVAIRNINGNSLNLSWYPGSYERFHEISEILPREAFVKCVGVENYDEKPHLFVKDSWLENLYLKSYSVFAMVDAINVKEAIKNNTLSKEKLINLRDAIDALSSAYPDVSFISFADSLLLKSNWTVGTFASEIKYTYEPEKFLYIFEKLQSIYQTHLALEIYGVFTQGSNAYYDENLLHISDKGNHICLNSLGTPFADLQKIEENARRCIRENIHAAAELYMDKNFYHSLKFKFEFRRENQSKQYYSSEEDSNAEYYYNDCGTILNNLVSVSVPS